MDEKFMFKEVLGDYGLTPAIASALKLIFRNPYESLLIVDQDAKIQFMDRRTEKFLSLRPGEAQGADIREFIPESGLPLTLTTGKAMIGRIFELNGEKRIGSVYPIIEKGKVVGAMGRLIFQSFEEVERINHEINILKKEIDYLKEKEQH
ncbi:MAG: hypothetical protein Q8K46_03465 [Deltaproteobacteria bacterium]|nr:hypothetical protein [Deltaproteobacteria bacterium]